MIEGSCVWFYEDGWRTGYYVRTIERGKDFGKIEIRSAVAEDRLVRVMPDMVEEMSKGRLECRTR